MVHDPDARRGDGAVSDRDPDRDPTVSGDDDTDHADGMDGTEKTERADEMPVDDDERVPFDGTDEELFGELDAPGEADPFTEMDADAETVGDEVFEMVGSDEEQPADLNIERDPAVEEVDEGVVVPKRSYCEQCPHFAEPPVVGCTNPGTTIHELVDVKHFRVSNCPVVEKQRDVRAPGE